MVHSSSLNGPSVRREVELHDLEYDCYFFTVIWKTLYKEVTKIGCVLNILVAAFYR